MTGTSLLTEAAALEFEERLRRLIAAGGEPAEFALARQALRPIFAESKVKFPDQPMAATFFLLAAVAAATAIVNGILPERRADLEATADTIRDIYAGLVEENLVVGFAVERGEPRGSPDPSGPGSSENEGQ